MNIARPPRIVVLGMMSRMPVAGVVWQTVHYLEGFRRLGADVFYVEAHGCTPRCFMTTPEDDGFAKAAAFIDGIMRRFDFGDRWCYHPLYGDGRHFGMSDTKLRELYASADLIINLHGGTEPLPEHSSGGRLIYVETDPVELQIELHENRPQTIQFLEPHGAFFSFGENFGSADCKLPQSPRFAFKSTRQPVIMDFWKDAARGDAKLFTTIGNWKQVHRQVHYQGETYYWSKHFEFLKFIDLPAHTAQRFELALSSYDAEDEAFLAAKGWGVRPGLSISENIDDYRAFIGESRGEYTVAKDQNVRFRTGWFSDRSATYLAAGRPVITQETGFSNVLPTGHGLFGFSTMDELIRAIDRINSDYERNCRSAREIAHEYFSHEVVLGQMLDDLGVVNRRSSVSAMPFPSSMTITPQARRPIKLQEATARSIRCKSVPAVQTRRAQTPHPRASIVVVTFNNLVFTRLCIESLLAHTGDCEVIVADNASTDGTPDYLRKLAAQNPRIRPIFNDRNLGFATANNRALATATGEVFVLLNNDTIVAPGWLPRLLAHLDDPQIGGVGPVTNRIGNEAEVDVECDTYGDFFRVAEAYAQSHDTRSFEIRTLTMFCFAMRRSIFERIGVLDEGFAIGLLEDDDYSMRMHHAGLKLLCAEDVFVYHFSQASFGDLVPTGRYGALLEQNKARFKQKWGVPWQPYARRRAESQENLLTHLRECVRTHVPAGANVLVIAKGDDELLKLGDRRTAHFPQDGSGGFAGWYPADSAAAVGHLEILRDKGARYLVFTRPSFWWFDFYREFREHLESRYTLINRDSECAIFSLQPTRTS